MVGVGNDRTKWIVPFERASKTVPESGVRCGKHFCWQDLKDVGRMPVLKISKNTYQCCGLEIPTRGRLPHWKLFWNFNISIEMIDCFCVFSKMKSPIDWQS